MPYLLAKRDTPLPPSVMPPGPAITVPRDPRSAGTRGRSASAAAHASSQTTPPAPLHRKTSKREVHHCLKIMLCRNTASVGGHAVFESVRLSSRTSSGRAQAASHGKLMVSMTMTVRASFWESFVSSSVVTNRREGYTWIAWPSGCGPASMPSLAARIQAPSGAPRAAAARAAPCFCLPSMSRSSSAVGVAIVRAWAEVNCGPSGCSKSFCSRRPAGVSEYSALYERINGERAYAMSLHD